MDHRFIEREAPLARCPLPHCRRSRQCQAEARGEPCRRTHESRDRFRCRLAAKLDRLLRDSGGPRADLPPPGEELDHYTEVRMADFKRALEAADAEYTRRDMEAKAAAAASQGEAARSAGPRAASIGLGMSRPRGEGRGSRRGASRR